MENQRDLCQRRSAAKQVVLRSKAQEYAPAADFLADTRSRLPQEGKLQRLGKVTVRLMRRLVGEDWWAKWLTTFSGRTGRLGALFRREQSHLTGVKLNAPQITLSSRKVLEHEHLAVIR